MATGTCWPSAQSGARLEPSQLQSNLASTLHHLVHSSSIHFPRYSGTSLNLFCPLFPPSPRHYFSPQIFPHHPSHDPHTSTLTPLSPQAINSYGFPRPGFACRRDWILPTHLDWVLPLPWVLGVASPNSGQPEDERAALASTAASHEPSPTRSSPTFSIPAS